MTKDECIAFYQVALAWKALQKAENAFPKAQDTPQEPPRAEIAPLGLLDLLCPQCGGTGLQLPHTLSLRCQECQGTGRAADPVNPP